MGNNVTFEKEGFIGIVTLKDASGLNLFNREMVLEIAEVQKQLEKEKSLRAVILKPGGDHFSCGVDLEFLKTVTPQFIKENIDFLQDTFGKWQQLPMPVIAGIKGLCYGAGVEMILGCDMRICADNARLAMPEVRLGLTADQGGTTRLVKLVGLGPAKRIILACDELDAQESLRINLVDYVVKPEELDERLLKLAKRISNMPPAAVRFGKKGIYIANENSTMAGLLFEQAQSTYCFGTEDMAEAIAAFQEKRKPEYFDK